MLPARATPWLSACTTSLARCSVRLVPTSLHSLHLRLYAGEISNLVQQPQFWFVIDGKPMKHRNGRRVGYQGDFAFTEGNRQVVVDAKGFAARDWPLRRALFEALFPDWELREV